ncbi:hypothetical protein T439DRAFT_327358 [Meredithblackwellia eburnea MCA 4105]
MPDYTGKRSVRPPGRAVRKEPRLTSSGWGAGDSDSKRHTGGSESSSRHLRQTKRDTMGQVPPATVHHVILPVRKRENYPIGQQDGWNREPRKNPNDSRQSDEVVAGSPDFSKLHFSQALNPQCRHSPLDQAVGTALRQQVTKRVAFHKSVDEFAGFANHFTPEQRVLTACMEALVTGAHWGCFISKPLGVGELLRKSFSFNASIKRNSSFRGGEALQGQHGTVMTLLSIAFSS